MPFSPPDRLPTPRPGILNNWQVTEHEDDRLPLLTVSGWRWAEDSFQSSPNSVTKTRFRNKILRDTSFPTFSCRLGEAKMHLPNTSSVQSSYREFGVETGPDEGTECELAPQKRTSCWPPPPQKKKTCTRSGEPKSSPGLTRASQAQAAYLRLRLSNLPSTDIPSRRAQHPSTRHSLKHSETLPKQTSTPRSHLTVSQTRKQEDPTSRIQTFRRSWRPGRS